VATEPVAPRPDLLRTLDESLASLTGREFFQVLARTLAEELGAHCAFVCEFTSGNTVAQPFAFWLDGRFVDAAPYALSGTPCERVLGGDVVVYERSVCDHFPADRADLEAVRAESYLAIPMKSRGGAIMGHVAVIDERGRSFADADLGVLRICSSRATAELEHLRVERQLAAMNRELEARVQERMRELEAARDEMEQRVLERTATLSAVNTRLRHEIAARAEAEAALRRQEEAYRDLYEEAPSVYWSTGADGFIQRANRRAAELFGREVVGEHYTNLIADTPDGLPRGRKVFARFLEGKPTYGEEFEFRGANGRKIWASVNLLPILGEDGKLVATRTTLADITERKCAEQALERRLALEQLLTEAATAFVGARPDDVDRALEQAITRIGAWGGSDRVRVFLYEQGRIEPELRREWRREGVAAGLATPVVPRPLLPLRDELVDVPRVDAAASPLEAALALAGVGGLMIVPVANASATLGYIELVALGRPHDWQPADVSLLRLLGELMASTLQRCQAERELVAARQGAEAASAAKSEFLARMSHELRTPLNAILGYAQLLQRDAAVGAAQRGQVETIRRSGEHLLTLIDDVLDLARVEAGKLDVSAVDTDLRALVRDVSAMFRERAENAGLVFRSELVEPHPRLIRADDRRLRQILINLLGNAVKFTHAGEVRLRVFAERGGGECWRATFEIADTGVGIAADDLRHIFDPFYQVAGRNSEGIGLGLAITRRLVEAMGGELTVASELRRGTTFTLTLETAAQGDEAAVAGAERTVQGYGGPRRRVLVVDDNADNRAVLAGWLVPHGFAVCEADSGEGAVAAVVREAPDLVLLDVVMPGIDGFETAARIRALPLPAQPKIAAITANAFETARRRSVAEGCDGFLAKPVDFAELEAMVGALLDLKWQHRETAAARAGREADAVPPSLPHADLKELLELARAGDVMAIEARVATLASEPRHAAFAAELGGHVSRMDLRAVERCLQPLLGKGAAP
jgi:PAS domain S-box-containing protein